MTNLNRIFLIIGAGLLASCEYEADNFVELDAPNTVQTTDIFVDPNGIITEITKLQQWVTEQTQVEFETTIVENPNDTIQPISVSVEANINSDIISLNTNDQLQTILDATVNNISDGVASTVEAAIGESNDLGNAIHAGTTSAISNTLSTEIADIVDNNTTTVSDTLDNLNDTVETTEDEIADVLTDVTSDTLTVEDIDAAIDLVSDALDSTVADVEDTIETIIEDTTEIASSTLTEEINEIVNEVTEDQITNIVRLNAGDNHVFSHDNEIGANSFRWFVDETRNFTHTYNSYNHPFPTAGKYLVKGGAWDNAEYHYEYWIVLVGDVDLDGFGQDFWTIAEPVVVDENVSTEEGDFAVAQEVKQIIYINAGEQFKLAVYGEAKSYYEWHKVSSNGARQIASRGRGVTTSVNTPGYYIFEGRAWDNIGNDQYLENPLFTEKYAVIVGETELKNFAVQTEVQDTDGDFRYNANQQAVDASEANEGNGWSIKFDHSFWHQNGAVRRGDYTSSFYQAKYDFTIGYNILKTTADALGLELGDKAYAFKPNRPDQWIQFEVVEAYSDMSIPRENYYEFEVLDFNGHTDNAGVGMDTKEELRAFEFVEGILIQQTDEDFNIINPNGKVLDLATSYIESYYNEYDGTSAGSQVVIQDGEVVGGLVDHYRSVDGLFSVTTRNIKPYYALPLYVGSITGFYVQKELAARTDLSDGDFVEFTSSDDPTLNVKAMAVALYDEAFVANQCTEGDFDFLILSNPDNRKLNDFTIFEVNEIEEDLSNLVQPALDASGYIVEDGELHPKPANSPFFEGGVRAPFNLENQIADALAAGLVVEEHETHVIIDGIWYTRDNGSGITLSFDTRERWDDRRPISTAGQAILDQLDPSRYDHIKADPTNIQLYVEQFIADAELVGAPLSAMEERAVRNGRIDIEDPFRRNPNRVGAYASLGWIDYRPGYENNQSPQYLDALINVRINPNWMDASRWGFQFRLKAIYHEIGHNLWGYTHPTGANDVVQPGHYPGEFDIMGYSEGDVSQEIFDGALLRFYFDIAQTHSQFGGRPAELTSGAHTLADDGTVLPRDSWAPIGN